MIVMAIVEFACRLRCQAWLLLLCCTTAAQATASLSYEVHVANSLDAATIHVECITCTKLPALRRLDTVAYENLSTEQTGGMTLHGGHFVADSGRRRANYSIKLHPDWQSRMLDQIALSKLRLFDPRRWLWVPADWSAQSPLQIEFILPKGITIATPWPRLHRRLHRYRLEPLLPSESGALVLGGMTQTQLDLGDAAILRVSIAGATAAQDRIYEDWIADSARNLVNTMGRSPLPLAQIVVIPIKRARGPVPFGLVRRGTGNTMLLFVNPTASAEALRADWTLAHELSHFAHPYFGDDGRWLAEGLAGYFQNAIRAQSGELSPEVASANLIRVFAATAKENDPGPVEDAGRMRTYWTAAVMALDIDLQLKKRSAKFATLAEAMSAFSEHHLPTRTAWSPEAYMRELDELGATKIFSQTFRRYANSRTFPEYESLTAQAAELFRERNASATLSPSQP